MTFMLNNFQSESKKSGDEFENIVFKDLKGRGFIDIKTNVYMLGTGCEVDFIADNKEYVEAKGGRESDKKRPGAQRTDNVKKAIANASIIKCKYPDIYYVVYFSAKPLSKSYSDEMINVALSNKIINEVRYISQENDKDIYMSLFDFMEQ